MRAEARDRDFGPIALRRIRWIRAKYRTKVG